MSWLKLLNLAPASNDEGAGRSAKLMIDGVIGGYNWFDDSGTTAAHFIRTVDMLDLGADDEIDVQLNSPGGVISDGVAITNYLMNHEASVRITVIGQAASIASVIAQAADPGKLHMGIGTTMFVHNPSVLLIDSYEARDLEKLAGTLDAMKNSIISIYANAAKRRGKELSDADIAELMDDATTMTAEEAVEWGLADTMDAELKAVACADVEKVLADVREKVKPEQTPTVQSFPEALAAALAEDRDGAMQAIAKALEVPESVFSKDFAEADMTKVFEACKKAGQQNLAVTLADSKLTMEEVWQRLDTASRISDICTAAKVDAAPFLDHIDDPVEMLRVAVVDGIAQLDADIDNKHPAYPKSEQEERNHNWDAVFRKVKTMRGETA